MHFSTYIAAVLAASASLVAAVPSAALRFTPTPFILNDPQKVDTRLIIQDDKERVLRLKEGEKEIDAWFDVESDGDAAKLGEDCIWLLNPIKDNIYTIRSGKGNYCAAKGAKQLGFSECNKEDTTQHWTISKVEVTDDAGAVVHSGIQIQSVSASDQCIESERGWFLNPFKWHAITVECHPDHTNQYHRLSYV